MTDAPRKTPAAPLLLLAALLLGAVGLGFFDWTSGPEEMTPTELRAALEKERDRPQGPIPGVLNEYRVEWQPRHLRVTDARGDWMWIALEDARATDLVFGLDVPQGDVQTAADGLHLLGAASVTSATVVPRDPTRVRVVTPAGVEERALRGSVHEDVAKPVFEGRERRPLREVLAGISATR